MSFKKIGKNKYKGAGGKTLTKKQVKLALLRKRVFKRSSRRRSK